jgi:TRAP-type C4-dicarboxylate transport system permease small subunit
MILPRLSALVDRLIGLCVLLGAAGILVALGVVSADVVARYFGSPIYGARDIVQMAGIFVVFGGMAYAHRRGGHISVDLLESRFSPGFNRVLLVAGHLLGAVVFLLIAWQLYEATKLARMLKMSTNLLYLPRAPFLWAMMAFSIVTALSMFLRAAEQALGQEARSGESS